MFLHHTMTDREILRSCEGCESPHLRLVADRLRARVDDLRTIGTLAAQVAQEFELGIIQDNIKRIADISKGGK